MTTDHGRPAEDLQQDLDNFVAGWWSRVEQFKVLLGGATEEVTFYLGPDGDDVYIQAHRELDGWLVEAESNNYLPEHAQLSVDDECTLVELGWQPPTDTAPNFFRFYDDPVDFIGMATDILVAFTAAYNGTAHGPYSVSPVHLLDALITDRPHGE